MKAAICSVCGQMHDPSNPGDWVKFSDFKENQKYDLTHPEGMEYFCALHVDQARALGYMISSEAIKKLNLSR